MDEIADGIEVSAHLSMYDIVRPEVQVDFCLHQTAFDSLIITRMTLGHSPYTSMRTRVMLALSLFSETLRSDWEVLMEEPYRLESS